MNKKLLLPLVLIPLLTVLLVAVLWWQPEPRQLSGHTLEVEERPQGGPFTLHGKTGTASLKDFRGQVVALYFGYTWCPDICPTGLAALSAAFNALSPEQQRQVQGIFVSVDPARDDIPRLEQYTAYFHPRLMGLTGDLAVLRETAGRYGAAFRREQTEDPNYAVDHSADLYLIDRQGALRETIAHGAPPEEILRALRRLLEE